MFLQLSNISDVSPANAAMFTDYLMENLKVLATDSEELVRIAFAQCLTQLADAGNRFIALTDTGVERTWALEADRDDSDVAFSEVSIDVL